jgi:hypothetical protein
MNIPAAIDASTYALRPDCAEDYAAGPAVLVAIDVRLSSGGRYVTKFAPVADTPSGVDMSAAFEDTFGEVEKRA